MPLSESSSSTKTPPLLIIIGGKTVAVSAARSKLAKLQAADTRIRQQQRNVQTQIETLQDALTAAGFHPVTNSD